MCSASELQTILYHVAQAYHRVFGNHIEQTVSVDDNILPAPQELAEYKSIDPKIVDFLIKSSEREQLHRHNQDEKKLKILSYNEHKVGRMNWWGMFFAFLANSTMSFT